MQAMIAGARKGFEIASSGGTMSPLLQRCPQCPRQLCRPAAMRRRRFFSSGLRCQASSQIAQIQTDVSSGRRSASDVLQQFLHVAEAQEPTLQSFITLDWQGATEQVCHVGGKRSAVGYREPTYLSLNENLIALRLTRRRGG